MTLPDTAPPLTEPTPTPISCIIVSGYYENDDEEHPHLLALPDTDFGFHLAMTAESMLLHGGRKRSSEFTAVRYPEGEVLWRQPPSPTRTRTR